MGVLDPPGTRPSTGSSASTGKFNKAERLVGVRRPKDRRLPAETGLDRHREAHSSRAGHHHLIPARPNTGRTVAERSNLIDSYTVRLLTRQDDGAAYAGKTQVDTPTSQPP